MWSNELCILPIYKYSILVTASLREVFQRISDDFWRMQKPQNVPK